MKKPLKLSEIFPLVKMFTNLLKIKLDSWENRDLLNNNDIKKMSLSKFEKLFSYLINIPPISHFPSVSKTCGVPSIHRHAYPVSLLSSGPSPKS